MTIFARNPDTGMAKWVYQMTPHDEWDYDGVNEMILSDQQIGGQTRKLLTHFDRNGLGYTLDRDSGELLVAEKCDPKVNWTSGVDMNKSSPTYGRPKVVPEYSTEKQDVNHKGICPAALGSKDEQPAAYSPDTGLFYVPTNHVCMDYEPFRVRYTADQPYVGAVLAMYPPQGETNMGNFIAWDAKTGKIAGSNKEQFSVWSGALPTACGGGLRRSAQLYLAWRPTQGVRDSQLNRSDGNDDGGRRVPRRNAPGSPHKTGCRKAAKGNAREKPFFYDCPRAVGDCRHACSRRRTWRSDRCQVRGRRVLRQGRKPNLQDTGGWHRRLVHLLGLSALPLGVSRLSRSRRRRIELRTGVEEFAQAARLQRFPRRRGGWAQERKHGTGKRHAGIRHQSECHVLYR